MQQPLAKLLLFSFISFFYFNYICVYQSSILIHLYFLLHIFNKKNTIWAHHLLCLHYNWLYNPFPYNFFTFTYSYIQFKNRIYNIIFSPLISQKIAITHFFMQIHIYHLLTLSVLDSPLVTCQQKKNKTPFLPIFITHIFNAPLSILLQYMNRISKHIVQSRIQTHTTTTILIFAHNHPHKIPSIPCTHTVYYTIHRCIYTHLLL